MPANEFSVAYLVDPTFDDGGGDDGGGDDDSDDDSSSDDNNSGRRGRRYKKSRNHHYIFVTLPPASTAISRFVTVRRVAHNGFVYIKPQSGEWLDGGPNSVRLTKPGAGVTFVTDGDEWVLLNRR
ncbi:MAG: hypothetical protein QF664_09695 [Dehalococcoidia bacterium]|jgi:hypothetical protein|nr:hypothetical protein [Dehalococcoidia bacterium]